MSFLKFTSRHLIKYNRINKQQVRQQFNGNSYSNTAIGGPPTQKVSHAFTYGFGAFLMFIFPATHIFFVSTIDKYRRSIEEKASPPEEPQDGNEDQNAPETEPKICEKRK